MFCDRCGTPLVETQRFCPSCGKPVAVAAPVAAPPPRGRVGSHVRVLGILWLAYAAIHLIPGFFLMAFFRPGIFPPDVPFFVHGILRMVGLFLVGGSVLGIMAGWGLLERQSWARTLAIVLGCFSLINVPFGTALGIYTLWVLLPNDSEMEYEQLARA